MLAILMLLAIFVDSRRAAAFTVYFTIGAWVLYSCVSSSGFTTAKVLPRLARCTSSIFSGSS